MDARLVNAYVTVTDASGRVLFRRPATAAEVDEARRVADEADAEAQASLARIAAERTSTPVMAEPEHVADVPFDDRAFSEFGFEEAQDDGFDFTEEDEGAMHR